MTTNTRTPSVLVVGIRDDRVAVGVDSGDRDDCGGPDESVRLTDVIVFDSWGDVVAQYDDYGVLVSGISDRQLPLDDYRLAISRRAEALDDEISRLTAERDRYRAVVDAIEVDL